MSDNTGSSGQWVSGPIRERISIGEGCEGFEVLLYWSADEGTDENPVTWVDFEIFEVTGYVEDTKTRMFDKRGASSNLDSVADVSEAECAVYGMVKWDGCTQFSMEPMHVDDHRDMIVLFDVILAVRRRCADVMGGLISEEYQISRKRASAALWTRVDVAFEHPVVDGIGSLDPGD